MSENTEKSKHKILHKYEWILLLIALGILAIVVLQNNGIHMVETTEEIEITEEERKAQEAAKESSKTEEANTFYEKKNLSTND